MSKRLWDKGQSLNEEVHAFTVGNDPIVDRRIACWDALASAAHGIMLSEIGILDQSELIALLPVLKEISEQAERDEFDIPSELEDCHTAIENVLTDRLGDIGRKIHTGRSRNDQVLVAMRLFLRDALIEILATLSGCAETLDRTAVRLGHVQIPGHTHFQPAMPCSAQMWLGAFYEECIELLRSGLNLLEEINTNPLGAASGFGVPLPLDRERTAELLGFARVQRNPVHVQNSRGRIAWRVASYCSEIAAMLEKFAWDCIIYSSPKNSFIKIPEEFTTGSSIMPQKRNPDVLELLRSRAGKVRAARDELEYVTMKMPSHYHRDLQYTKEPVMHALQDALAMLHISELIVDRLEIDRAAAEAALSIELYATFDAYRQVREGVPFRTAYLESARRLKAGELEVSDLKSEFGAIVDQIDAEFELARADLKCLNNQRLQYVAATRKAEHALFSTTA